MLVQLVDLTLHGGVALLLLAALMAMFVKAPRASVTLVLLLAVLEGSREWPVRLGTSVGTVNVNWADVATALMGGVALAHLAWRNVRAPAKGALLGLTMMAGIGLLSWTLLVGLQPAVNFWRPWTFAVAAALYAASSPRLRQPGGLRPFVWAAVLGSLTQVIGFARGGFGSNADAVIVNGEVVGARPVSAAVALIMLIGMVVVLLDGRGLSVAKLGLASWLGLSVVLAQHRSVWVAAAVAGVLIVRALASRSRQRLVFGRLGGLGVVLAGLAISAVVRSQQQLSVSASSTGTFEWRVENWIEKLTTERSALQWLAGAVFGPTPLNDLDSQLVFRVSSHSMYVESIAVVGLLGLALLVVVVVGTIRGTRVGMPERVVVVSLLAFGFFYQWPGVVWLVVGAAVAGRGPSGSRPVPSEAVALESRSVDRLAAKARPPVGRVRQSAGPS